MAHVNMLGLLEPLSDGHDALPIPPTWALLASPCNLPAMRVTYTQAAGHVTWLEFPAEGERRRQVHPCSTNGGGAAAQQVQARLSMHGGREPVIAAAEWTHRSTA